MSQDPDKLSAPGNRPPRSEHSFGPGMFPNPNIDYEGRVDPKLAAVNRNGHPTLDEQVRDLIAYRRLDSTQKGEKLEDMYYAAGNTDRFGPQPPLVNADDKKTERDPGPEPKHWRMERAW